MRNCRGYRKHMSVAFVLIAVVLVVGAVLFMNQRRAEAVASTLRAGAADHRAATLEREVADDVDVHVDNIDPDMPITSH